MRIQLYHPQAIHQLGKRANQEDTIYPTLGDATSSDRLFIVCDGMGGHEHGEVASGTFATALADYFKTHVNHEIALDDDQLAAAIDFAYRKLDLQDDGNLKKMGTTLTLLYFHRGGVTAAHIGDSRIYHVRPGQGLLYVSRDHSLVYDLFQSGEISFDEMATSPQKNVITRAVQPGLENRVKPDIIHITDVRQGDYFYLCSDGMLEQMSDEELAQLLSAKGSDEKKCQQLIAATADNSDNHSAYIIRVEQVEREESDFAITTNEEKTSRRNALNIRPATAIAEPEDDVQVVSDVLVTQPVRDVSTVTKPAFNRLWLLAVLATLVVAGGMAFMTLRPSTDEHKTQPVDTIKQPVVIPVQPQPITKPVLSAPIPTQREAQPQQPQPQSSVKKDPVVKPQQPDTTKNKTNSGVQLDNKKLEEKKKEKEKLKQQSKPHSEAPQQLSNEGGEHEI